MTRIKILHIITRLDPGGSSTNTIETVARLVPSRFVVFLLCGLTQDPDGRIEASLRSRGIRYRFLNDLRRAISPWHDLRAFISLYCFMRKERFDIVHTHSSKAGILGRWAAWLAGVRRIIHTPHGHVFYGYFGRMPTLVFIWLERFTALITEKIVTLTDRGSAEHVAFRIASASKFVTICSGIEVPSTLPSNDEIVAIRREWHLPAGACVFGTVARLEPVKGITYLVDAMARAACQQSDIRLVIIGDGDERLMLEEKCNRLGVRDLVVFLGFRDDAARLIAGMDVFVLPSLNEGMGRVVLEAMALAKPVIATRVGGLPELVRDGENGWLVPPGDPEALAAVMRRCASDRVRRGQMGEMARTSVGEKFSIDTMLQCVERLYDDNSQCARLSRWAGFDRVAGGIE